MRPSCFPLQSNDGRIVIPPFMSLHSFFLPLPLGRCKGESNMRSILGLIIFVMVAHAPLPLCVAMSVANLSPIEATFLQPRLDKISAAIQDEYKELSNIDNSINTFIFPGAGGVDILVEELCTKVPGSKIIDWSEHRGNIFTAAYDGEAVGDAIANLLISRYDVGDVKGLHFIGISVGAFCANSAATKTYQQLKNAPPIKLTLLDPFCGRGVFGGSYGKANFGKFATTAIQILNTDDPVPTTNEPLPFCYCLDVTGAPEREAFEPLPGDSMHSWPVAYLARHFQVPQKEGVPPRGKVVKVGES